jgi:hypothetical protein
MELFYDISCSGSFTISTKIGGDSMKTNPIYGVFHIYTVDVEFGEAISREDFLCIFATKEEAIRFAETYSKPHAYDECYECGRLVVKEMPTAMDKSRMWWLKKGIFEYQGFEVLENEDFSEEPLPMASPEEMDNEWDKLPKFVSFTRVA